MTKQLFSACAFFICTIHGIAQPTQEQMNKMLSKAQQKANALKNDPRLKPYLNKEGLGKMTASYKETQGGVPGMNMYTPKPDTTFLSRIKLPQKNTSLLATLPPHPPGKTELIAVLSGMKSRLVSLMKQSGATNPMDVSDYDGNSLGNAAVVTWYTGDKDNAFELALDAAQKSPDNVNALNNLSSILSICGFPHKAIPILEYVNEQQPGNSTVINNLGQAYLALGEQEKGKAYLEQAVAKSPDHPTANLALAYLAYETGDKTGAAKYCEHSLRGSFTSEAWTMLKAIHPKAKLMDYIRHRYHQPDFFSLQQYPLLPQCRNVKEVNQLTAQYKQYDNMLTDMQQQYNRLVKQEEDYLRKHFSEIMMDRIKQHRFPLRPFGAFASSVLYDISEDYGEKRIRLQSYDSIYANRMKALKDEYDAALKEVSKQYEDKDDALLKDNAGAYCNAVNALSNAYMPRFAELTEERQQEWMKQVKDYFNDYAFWCYVASSDDHQYREMFYSLVGQYLTLLHNLTSTTFLKCSLPDSYTNEKTDSLEFREGRCPFKANIDVEVEENGKKNTPASFEIDCEAFAAKFKMSNGISFKMKNTAAGVTTLAFNGGLGIGEVLSGSMQAYMTFGGNQPFDVGFKWDYEMKLPEPLGGKNSAGWGVSMNTMADFHGEGKLVNQFSSWAGQHLFDAQPAPQQINQNVRMYHH